MHVLRLLVGRLKKRADSEHEQALLRMGLGALVGAYFFYACLRDNAVDASEYGILLSLTIFFCAAIAIVIHIAIAPARNPARRIAGIAIDSLGTTVLLLQGGEMAIPVYPVYLWITVGNGCRFGTKYLLVASIMNAAGFAALPFANQYWAVHQALFAGLLLTLVAVPPYLVVLLRRLENTSRELAFIASHDPLTGVYNRRALVEQLRKEFSRSIRYNTQASLIMFDIDFFKRVNDTYGHQAGDEVLRSVANVALTLLRETDIMARYGGEEFVAILPNTGEKGAMYAAQRLKDGIESLTTSFEEHKINVTISSGVVSNCSKFTDFGHMLHCADEGLYLSKEKGRNCITVNTPTGPEGLSRPGQATQPALAVGA